MELQQGMRVKLPTRTLLLGTVEEIAPGKKGVWVHVVLDSGTAVGPYRPEQLSIATAEEQEEYIIRDAIEQAKNHNMIDTRVVCDKAIARGLKNHARINRRAWAILDALVAQGDAERLDAGIYELI